MLTVFSQLILSRKKLRRLLMKGKIFTANPNLGSRNFKFHCPNGVLLIDYKAIIEDGKTN